MKLYQIPIDFQVTALTPEAAYTQLADYLRQAMLDHGNHYDIVDWEAPVGYPVEELKQGDCCR